MSYAWALLAIIFWQPIAMTAFAIFHKIKGDAWDVTMYMGDMKAWFLTLYDLLKYKSIK